jgi:general stress protein YciG
MAHDNANVQGESQQDRGQLESSQGQTQGSTKKSNRGFASMDRGKQREIASKGGRAAHEKGTAHQFTTDEAREAGRKGGGTVSQDRQHMAEIGRIGGQARGRKQRAAAAQQNQPRRSEETANTEGKPSSGGDYRH